MNQICTWVDCQSTGIHPQLSKGGEVWACLCDEHHLKLEADLDSLDVKRILSSWVKAQGGAAKAAGRV